jgi:hypothetical protein
VVSGSISHAIRSIRRTAVCLLCKTKLKCIGGSTKSLNVHLQSKIGLNLLKRGDDSEVHDDIDNRKEGASAATAANTRARAGAENVTSLSKFFASTTDNSLEATIARVAFHFVYLQPHLTCVEF